jgi:ribonuclease HI
MLFTFFDRLSISQVALAAMTLWSLWKCRNSKLWDNVDTPPLVVINRARDTLYEWSYMQQAKNSMQEITHDALWEKPPLTVVKCNVDCALFNNNSIMGYGLCFRDSMGHFLLGMSNYEFHRVTPSEAEATGLLEAVKLAIARGMQSVIFESDCKIVVDAVNSSVNPHNELGDIIFYCKQLLCLHPNFFVRFVRRQANKVAHNIARASLSHPSPHIFSDVPSSLNPLLLNDMN